MRGNERLTKLFTRSVKRNTSHESRVTSHAPAGFTLTEVIVASALLIIAMVPILRALTSAHASSTSIEYKTRGLALAQAKLDDIKARSTYDYTNGGASFAESNTSLDGSYLCNVPDDAAYPLKTITVSVGYDDNEDSTLDSGEVEVTLATYLVNRWD